MKSPPPGRRPRRRAAARSLTLAVSVLALLLMLAGPAAAHPTLLTTVPAAGYGSDGPVGQIVLAFDEPVTATPGAVTVTRIAGRRQPAKPLQLRAGGRQLVLPLSPPLSSGQFLVHWRVTAEDGDVVDGTFAFGVGTAAPAASSEAATTALGGTVALRWLLFAALAFAGGGLLGERLVHRQPGHAALPMVLAPLRSAAAAGLLATAGLTALVAAAAGGWPALTRVRAVELTVAETAAFALALPLTWLPRLRRFTAAPLATVVVAEGLRAHPQGYAPGWGAALTVVHLTAAALWAGALVHVVRTIRAWRGHPGAARMLLRDYARIAPGLFLLVVATGTVASLLVVRRPSDLIATGYGRVLAAKLAVVAAITALAVVGRRRIHRNPPTPAAEPSRAARVERSLLVGVLAVTALLVSLPAPRPTATALTLPPPPSGPTAAFGALLGQLSLGATASTGQLQLRLSAPGSDPRQPDEDAKLDARVRVTLQPATGPPVIAQLRGCGPGCYVAAAEWRTGVNRVTVATTAPGWHGGSAAFTVPWPPTDATAQLHAMLTALRRTATVVLSEVATSDTTRPGSTQHLRITGDAFLETEPFGNGGAPIVTVLPSRGARRPRLAVAYPAIGVYLTLTLDAQHRPIHEVEATPNHLITRIFAYPTS